MAEQPSIESMILISNTSFVSQLENSKCYKCTAIELITPIDAIPYTVTSTCHGNTLTICTHELTSCATLECESQKTS